MPQSCWMRQSPPGRAALGFLAGATACFCLRVGMPASLGKYLTFAVVNISMRGKGVGRITVLHSMALHSTHYGTTV